MSPRPLLNPEEVWALCTVNPATGCLLWNRSVDLSGYSRFSFRGRLQGGHRNIWVMTRGEIPAGQHVLHSCDRFYSLDDKTYRRCLNVEHLWLGTNLENVRDMVQKGRHWAQVEPNIMSRSRNAKMTREVILHIRESKETHAALAKRFGLSTCQVGRIKRRDVWTHVT